MVVIDSYVGNKNRIQIGHTGIPVDDAVKANSFEAEWLHA